MTTDWRYIFTENNKYQVVSTIVASEANDCMDVLDVGCRDAIMRSYLPSVPYYGADVSLNYNSPNFQRANLEEGPPFIPKKFSLVIALDVLEHCNNIHQAFHNLYDSSSKHIVISLPNEFYINPRIRFFLSGKCPSKFIFNSDPNGDRHRWLFDIGNLKRFLAYTEYQYGFTSIKVFSYIRLPRLRISRPLFYMLSPFKDLLTRTWIIYYAK